MLVALCVKFKLCNVSQVLNKVISIAGSPKNRAKVDGEQKAAKPAKVRLRLPPRSPARLSLCRLPTPHLNAAVTVARLTGWNPLPCYNPVQRTCGAAASSQ